MFQYPPAGNPYTSTSPATATAQLPRPAQELALFEGLTGLALAGSTKNSIAKNVGIGMMTDAVIRLFFQQPGF